MIEYTPSKELYQLKLLFLLCQWPSNYLHGSLVLVFQHSAVKQSVPLHNSLFPRPYRSFITENFCEHVTLRWLIAEVIQNSSLLCEIHKPLVIISTCKWVLMNVGPKCMWMSSYSLVCLIIFICIRLDSLSLSSLSKSKPKKSLWSLSESPNTSA